MAHKRSTHGSAGSNHFLCHSNCSKTNVLPTSGAAKRLLKKRKINVAYWVNLLYLSDSLSLHLSQQNCGWIRYIYISSILCKLRNMDLILSCPLITLLCCDKSRYVFMGTISCFSTVIFLWVTVTYVYFGFFAIPIQPIPVSDMQYLTFVLNKFNFMILIIKKLKRERLSITIKLSTYSTLFGFI